MSEIKIKTSPRRARPVVQRSVVRRRQSNSGMIWMIVIGYITSAAAAVVAAQYILQSFGVDLMDIINSQ